jgi:hypothetical protein
VPDGIPRILSNPYPFEVVQTPNEVHFLYEFNHAIRLISLDKPLPPAAELEALPWYLGHSIGHWEGDTLVIETRSIRGGIPIDRTGAALSDAATVVERIRKVDARTLQTDVTIEDPIAFTRPWKVTRRYTKRPEEFPRMENVSSLENNRNPIVNGETSIRLSNDSDASSPYPPDIRPYAVPKFPVPKP